MNLFAHPWLVTLLIVVVAVFALVIWDIHPASPRDPA